MWLMLLACAPADPTPRAASPDIILIATDAVRWDHTSLSDYPHDTTPTLRLLAEQPGTTTFSRAYAAASWPLPATASLLTGQDALTHGVGFTRSTIAVPTLAEQLAAHGYQTAAFTAGPHLDRANGFAHGVETFRHEQDLVPLTPQIDRALDWIAQARTAESPYFLFLQGFDAAPPYTAPAIYAELFSPPYEGDLHLGRGQMRTGECRVVDTRSCTPLLSTIQRQRGEEADLSHEHAHINTHYDSALRAGDYNLNRLLVGLEQGGAFGEAIVVVVSSLGRSLAEGRYPDETGRAEQLYHVPLLIHRPTQAASATWPGVVSLTDVLPTLLDLAGAADETARSGISLRPILDDPSQSADGERVVRSAELCCDAVHTAAWSLLGTPAQEETEPGWALYASGTTDDVSADHPELVAQLRAHLSTAPRLVEPEHINGAAGQQPALRRILRQHGYWTPGEVAR